MVNWWVLLAQMLFGVGLLSLVSQKYSSVSFNQTALERSLLLIMFMIVILHKTGHY